MALAPPNSRTRPTLPGLRPEMESPRGFEDHRVGEVSLSRHVGEGGPAGQFPHGWGNIGFTYEMGHKEFAGDGCELLAL